MSHRTPQIVYTVEGGKFTVVQGAMITNTESTRLYVRVNQQSFKVSRRPPANYGVKKP
jgi:hypothetical protein